MVVTAVDAEFVALAARFRPLQGLLSILPLLSQPLLSQPLLSFCNERQRPAAAFAAGDEAP